MKELTDAVAQAQAEMKNAAMNKTNPHFKSKYADLGAIRDAVIPPLAKQGVALVQLIETREYGPAVVTKLMKDGQEIVSECPVLVENPTTPQKFGSALTYARRYSLACICGIASEEDDDGNAAEANVDMPVADPEGYQGPKGGKTRYDKTIQALETDMRKCATLDELTVWKDANQQEIDDMKITWPSRATVAARSYQEFYRQLEQLDQLKADTTPPGANTEDYSDHPFDPEREAIQGEAK